MDRASPSGGGGGCSNQPGGTIMEKYINFMLE